MPSMTAMTAKTYHEHDPRYLLEVHTPKAPHISHRVLDAARGLKHPHPWSIAHIGCRSTGKFHAYGIELSSVFARLAIASTRASHHGDDQVRSGP